VAPAAAGSVTLSQAQFDMLCNKLHGLEDSISELRNEISRNQGRNGSDNHDPALYAARENELPGIYNAASNNQTNGQTNGVSANGSSDGKAPQFQRHAATHGIHAKNELVGVTHTSVLVCELTRIRDKLYISAQVQYRHF
jgi:hypothetical protein